MPGKHRFAAAVPGTVLTTRRRRWLLWGAFLVSGIFLLGADVVEDVTLHLPTTHVVEELAFVLPWLLGVALLVRRTDSLLTSSQRLSRELGAARRDLEAYRRRTGDLTRGLGEKIEQQLRDWALTPSEREVARLLLKGLGHRQVAEVRGTSEKTARQQAAAIYQKSGLSGRAELSAFFLEDLLVLEPHEAPATA
jgi:DNA-binding CsgD family transcriptional regulator